MEEKVDSSLSERAIIFLKSNVLFVGLVILGLILFTVGFFQYISSRNSSGDVEFVAADADVKGASASSTFISVDVEGQVQKPGVYRVIDVARLQDALIAAGGMSQSADREYISKHLNLAQKVIDGGKIYIPGINEDITDTSVVNNISSNQEAGSTLGDNSGLININSATAEELDTLPKVGAVTAQKIISGRPYTSIEDLVNKKILGQKTYDGLKDKIMVE
jgi:competence protein ComEA